MTVSIIVPHSDLAMLIHGPLARAIGFPILRHVTSEHTLYLYDYNNTVDVKESVKAYLNTVHINTYLGKKWECIHYTDLDDYFDACVQVELDVKDKLLRKYASKELLSELKLLRN